MRKKKKSIETKNKKQEGRKLIEIDVENGKDEVNVNEIEIEKSKKKNEKGFKEVEMMEENVIAENIIMKERKVEMK